MFGLGIYAFANGCVKQGFTEKRRKLQSQITK